MAAVLTVLFILCFNSFASHAAAADFWLLCGTKAQPWQPMPAEGSPLEPLPKQRC